MSLTIETLAAEKDYQFGGNVYKKDEPRLVRLMRGDRMVQVNEQLIADIIALSQPLSFKKLEEAKV